MSLIEIPWRPPASTLRWFAVLCLAALGAAGAAAWHRGDVTWGLGLIAAGLAVGATGLAYPAAVRPVFVGSLVVTYPVGWVVSHVLLAAVYYCLFAPVGLFFRLTGRDALTRRPDARLDSYWVPKEAPGETARYFYQS